MSHLSVFASLVSVVAVLALSTGLMAQDAIDALADEAVAILHEELGTWKSRWDNLDGDGEVFSSTDGVETFSRFNGDRVLLLETHVPSAGRTNKAFRFYNPALEKLMIIDVQPDGRHYILHQEVGGKVLESEPVMGRDGQEIILRFTTIEDTEYTKTVNHEISRDGGETWRLFRRQHMEKVSTDR